MDMTCNMAMDLVVLYKDGLASDDTRRAVRMHLHDCPDCRRAYASYKKTTDAVGKKHVPLPEYDLSQGYQALAKHLRKRHVLSSAAVIGVMVLSATAGVLATLKMLRNDE